MKKKKPDLLRIIALLIIILGIIYFYLNLFAPNVIAPLFRTAVIDKPINILILGTDLNFDIKTNRKITEVSRTDTIMLLHFDPLKQRVNLLSIPRDSYVNIPGYGYTKINAAYVYGGIDLVKETLKDLTGIEVENYLLINTSATVKLIDLLGGINIEVEKNLYYNDNAQNLHINLKAGKQNLSGKQAEGYIRFRHDALGDIGRIERQQKFLKAITSKLATPSALLKAPFILGLIRKNIKTDLSLKKSIIIGNTFRMMKITAINTITVPGEPTNNQAGSVWMINKPELKEILRQSFGR